MSVRQSVSQSVRVPADGGNRRPVDASSLAPLSIIPHSQHALHTQQIIHVIHLIRIIHIIHNTLVVAMEAYGRLLDSPAVGFIVAVSSWRRRGGGDRL
jgi:hypothetical protein